MCASDSWICGHCTPEVGEHKKTASKAKANKGNDKLKIKAFEQDDDFLVETQSPKDKKNSMSVNKYMAAYIQVGAKAVVRPAGWSRITHMLIKLAVCGGT